MSRFHTKTSHFEPKMKALSPVAQVSLPRPGINVRITNQVARIPRNAELHRAPKPIFLKVMRDTSDDGVVREEGIAVGYVVLDFGHTGRAIAIQRPWSVD